MKMKKSYWIALLVVLLLLSGLFGKGLLNPGSEPEAPAAALTEVLENLPAQEETPLPETEEPEAPEISEPETPEPAVIEPEESEEPEEIPAEPEESESEPEEEELPVSEDGTYTSKDEVAAYLYYFGHLPDNYITKKEAQKRGWDKSKNTMAQACPGMSIGGDWFGNFEGLLPEKKGREYYECDIDYVKGGRNAKRIIYSNDGLIYYTDDHYESFELLYGEE